MNPKIKNIVYIIIGLYFITSPFIFKVIIIKAPKTLMELSLIIVLFFLIVYFFVIVKSMRLLLKISSTENILFQILRDNIILPLQELYYNSMKIIDNYIKHKFLGPVYLGENLLKITFWINKNITDNIFPRIFFIIIFLYDAVFRHEFIFIYYFGAILLIPLIFSYIMFTFKEFALANMRIAYDDYLIFADDFYNNLCFDDVRKNYETTSLNQIQNIKIIKNISVKNKEDYENLEKNLTYYIEQFHIFTQIYNTCMLYDHIKNLSLFKILFIIFNIFYFLIWLYIFFFLSYEK